MKELIHKLRDRRVIKLIHKLRDRRVTELIHKLRDRRVTGMYGNDNPIDWTVRLSEGVDPLCQEAADALEHIAALHERLENNRVFDADGNRIDVEPGSIPDGISCRDETIRLLEQRVTTAEARCVEYRTALVRYNENARSFFWIANRIATELGTHALQTNFGGFAEATKRLLDETHALTNEARAALAKEEKRG